METPKFIWMDGNLVPGNKAVVPFLTHTLHYGTGVFEGIRCYSTLRGPAIFRLPEHIRRLFYSASVLGIKIPYSAEDLKRAIIEIIKSNSLSDCYIRPLVYLGGKMGLSPIGAPVHCGIAVWRWDKYLTNPMIKTIISKYIRIHPQSSIVEAKITGHYVNSALTSLEAYNAGADEAILLDYEEYVAEGPAENIFMIYKNFNGIFILTPSLGTILPGITRATVIQLINDYFPKLKVIEDKMDITDLKIAKEVFFTGTAVEIAAVDKIDDVVIAQDNKPGPITRFVQTAYSNVVHGRIKKYRHWLTYVD